MKHLYTPVYHSMIPESDPVGWVSAIDIDCSIHPGRTRTLDMFDGFIYVTMDYEGTSYKVAFPPECVVLVYAKGLITLGSSMAGPGALLSSGLAVMLSDRHLLIRQSEPEHNVKMYPKPKPKKKKPKVCIDRSGITTLTLDQVSDHVKKASSGGGDVEESDNVVSLFKNRGRNSSQSLD